jgi:hypothetical protein
VVDFDDADPHFASHPVAQSLGVAAFGQRQQGLHFLP